MIDFYTIEPCATSNAFEIKFKKATRIDLSKAGPALSSIGQILGQTSVVIFFKTDSCAASIYASGRVVLKNVGREYAEQMGRRIADALEQGGAFQ